MDSTEVRKSMKSQTRLIYCYNTWCRMFWSLFIFCGHSAPEPASVSHDNKQDYWFYPAGLHGKLHQPKQLQFQRRERSWNQRRWITNWNGNEEIRTRKKFQAVDKTCMTDPRLYSRTFVRSHTHRGSKGLPVCWSQKVVAGPLPPLALSPFAIPWHDALLLGTILHSDRHSYISTPTYQCFYSSTPTYQCLYSSTPTYQCLYSSTPTHQCLYSSTPRYRCLYISTPTYQCLYICLHRLYTKIPVLACTSIHKIPAFVQLSLQVVQHETSACAAVSTGSTLTAVSASCTPRYQCLYSCLCRLYTKVPVLVQLSLQAVHQGIVPVQLSLQAAHQGTVLVQLSLQAVHKDSSACTTVRSTKRYQLLPLLKADIPLHEQQQINL